MKLNGTKIVVELAEVLDHMGPEDKKNCAEILACEDVIIESVTEQILGRWTPRTGCKGNRSVRPTDEPQTALDKACREVAKRASDAAKKEIERLEKSLARHKDRVRDMEEAIEELREQIRKERQR